MDRADARLIHTKIMATLGPGSSDPQTLQRLIRAGADVFRLNFSHGSLEEHAATLRRLRGVAASLGVSVAIAGDLAGPKIRLDTVEEVDEGGMRLEAGDTLLIQRGRIAGRAGRASVNYDQFIDEVQPGHRVLIDDGAVRLIVVDKTEDEVTCRCTVGGIVRSRKGVNLPDTELTLPALTEHDERCVQWAIEHGLDYVALSFVRRAQELHTLRQQLLAGGSGDHVIAKIEKPEAVRHIDPIIDAADVIMIARGDLGVEMDVAEVPIIQKDIIRRCAAASKPVIVATQMLQSMISSATPTRAEVSDVANAIYDGTDVVMLSGETAVGGYPVLAVNMMNHIARRTEQYLFTLPPPAADQTLCQAANAEEAALARGACQMAQALRVKRMAVWSQSGVLARFFSKLRPRVPVVAISSDATALRRMSLYFGIEPIHLEAPESIDDLIPAVDRMLTAEGLAAAGDAILIVGGTTPGRPGRANAIMLHKVGEPVPHAGTRGAEQA